MKHYLFTDKDGEQDDILIGAETLEEATEIALKEYCANPEYEGTMSDIEAEWSGLDEL